jgi:hypothetical protein
MNPAARSIAIYGVFLLGAGALLAFAPPPALRHANPAAPYEPVRLLGVLTLAVGSYYLGAAWAANAWFVRASVTGRLLAVTMMGVLVAVDLARPTLLGVAALDLVTAVWTYRALRREGER